MVSLVQYSAVLYLHILQCLLGKLRLTAWRVQPFLSLRLKIFTSTQLSSFQIVLP